MITTSTLERREHSNQTKPNDLMTETEHPSTGRCRVPVAHTEIRPPAAAAAPAPRQGEQGAAHALCGAPTGEQPRHRPVAHGPGSGRRADIDLRYRSSIGVPGTESERARRKHRRRGWKRHLGICDRRSVKSKDGAKRRPFGCPPALSDQLRRPPFSAKQRVVGSSAAGGWLSTHDDHHRSKDGPKRRPFDNRSVQNDAPLALQRPAGGWLSTYDDHHRSSASPWAKLQMGLSQRPDDAKLRHNL